MQIGKFAISCLVVVRQKTSKHQSCKFGNGKQFLRALQSLKINIRSAIAFELILLVLIRKEVKRTVGKELTVTIANINFDNKVPNFFVCKSAIPKIVLLTVLKNSGWY